MNNKEVFLSRFVNQFLEQGRKRKSHENTIRGISLQINKVSRKKFDKKLTFSENEIIKAFEDNGFTVMNNFDQEMDWGKFRDGTLLPKTQFINVKTAKLRRLISANVKSPKSNWNPDTVLEVENLKLALSEFWESNKDMVN